VLDVGDDGTRLGLGASTTSLGAGTKLGPARDLAVDGAGLSVAGAVFSVGAFVTTVLGSDVNLVVTGLLASAASLGAGGPGVPGVGAVDAARVSVAVLLGRYGIANLAAVLDVGDDGLDTSLHTATAEFGAGSEGSPAGDDAIDGAGLGVARLNLAVCSARNTTVGSRGDHRFGGFLGTNAASLAASGPLGPVGEYAVNSAGLSLADS